MNHQKHFLWAIGYSLIGMSLTSCSKWIEFVVVNYSDKVVFLHKEDKPDEIQPRSYAKTGMMLESRMSFEYRFEGAPWETINFSEEDYYAKKHEFGACLFELREK